MIDVSITKDQSGQLVEFKVKNHGNSNVCAAVSMLTLNTVNSIESFTEDNFFCEYDESGGYLLFRIDSPDVSEGTKTLLKSLELGLVSTLEEYPDEINVKIAQSGLIGGNYD